MDNRTDPIEIIARVDGPRERAFEVWAYLATRAGWSVTVESTSWDRPGITCGIVEIDGLRYRIQHAPRVRRRFIMAPPGMHVIAAAVQVATGRTGRDIAWGYHFAPAAWAEPILDEDQPNGVRPAGPDDTVVSEDRQAEGSAMDTRAAAQRWARTWAESWPAKDAEAIVALQSVDGVHWASMFRRYDGRDGLRAYLREAFGDESAPAEVRFAEPRVDGDLATVEYWAQVTIDGPMTISGCTLVRFDDTGLVTEARDYSHAQPGHHTPPESLFA